MEIKQDGQVIYLKDLLFAALYKWRTIVVWALALALVLGIGKGVLSFLNMNNEALQLENSKQEEIELEVYETKMDTLQQQIDENRKNAQHQQEYLDKSILMNLDPYNFYEVYLSVYIDTNYQIMPELVYQNPDLTNALINSYIERIKGEESAQALAAAVGTESEYLLELLSAEAPYDTRTLILRAKAIDEASAQKLLQQLLQHIQNIQPDIIETVGAHELRVKEQYTRPTMDNALALAQQDQVDKLTELNNSILTLQQEMRDLLPPQSIVVSAGSVVKDAVIFAVIGGVLGVLLVVLFAWVRHMASNKVYSARTLFSRTGVKILGCVYVTENNCKVNRWIQKLEGRSLIPAQKQYELLAYSIRSLCGSTNRLLVAGQTAPDTRADLIVALRQAMPGTQIIDEGSLLQDINARKALDETAHVLLVEQCGVSGYSELDQQLDVIDSHNASILGCVLLDG